MSISGSKMKKTLAAGLAAVTLAGTAIVSATPASAQWGWRGGYGWGGPAVAAGVIGGLAVGSALAARPYYGGPYGYYGAYAPAGYPYGGECVIERRRTVDPWGRVIVRRVRTCY
jgi:hypothetical protein